jgi:hypothetical protein
MGFAPASRGRWNMPERVEPTAQPEKARSERVGQLLAAARTPPNLQMIEWDADAGDDAAPALPAAREDARTLEPRRRKLRDRYIAARFPGIARSGADLADSAAVVESARLLFEDGRVALALELLLLAAEESRDAAPALARLEILFLQRDAAGFVAGARAFRAEHQGHEAWEEVTRLGRAIAPGDPLFGAHAGARAHEHYGPWPHLPNWIQAPWDLTAEVCAADFHRALALA